MDVRELVSGVLGDKSEETETVVEVYELITQSAPTIASEAKTHMILLDHARTKLSTVYYMLCREISRMKDEVRSSYDSQYTRLVKLGRPTKDAIESEIRATNPQYSGVSKTISDYEDVKNLINMYLRCIDSSKQTTVELLRNINRID